MSETLQDKIDSGFEQWYTHAMQRTMVNKAIQELREEIFSRKPNGELSQYMLGYLHALNQVLALIGENK